MTKSPSSQKPNTTFDLWLLAAFVLLFFLRLFDDMGKTLDALDSIGHVVVDVKSETPS